MFMDEEVISNYAPSPWVKITSSRMSEPAKPTHSQKQSHSQNWGAHARGSFVVAHNIGRSKPVATIPMVHLPTASIKRVETQPESTVQQWMPPPGFTEIAKSLWGDDPPHVTAGVPPELTAPQGLLAGTAKAMMISMRLHQDVALGITYLDMVTTSMSLVGLGATPMAVDHPMAALEEWKDSESN